jgi:hypothetical protein
MPPSVEPGPASVLHTIWPVRASRAQKMPLWRRRRRAAGSRRWRSARCRGSDRSRSRSPDRECRSGTGSPTGSPGCTPRSSRRSPARRYEPHECLDLRVGEAPKSQHAALLASLTRSRRGPGGQLRPTETSSSSWVRASSQVKDGAACRDRTDDLPLTRSTVSRTRPSATVLEAAQHPRCTGATGGGPERTRPELRPQPNRGPVCTTRRLSLRWFEPNTCHHQRRGAVRPAQSFYRPSRQGL